MLYNCLVVLVILLIFWLSGLCVMLRLFRFMRVLIRFSG